MQTRRIDGKALAEKVRAEVATQVQGRAERSLPTPGLATILVGEDPASQVYVRNKQRSAGEVGIHSQGFDLPADVSQDEVAELISQLNADDSVHGILLQLPVPPQLDEAALIQLIDPRKDVDGLHPVNAGLLAQKGRQPLLAPATPSGVMRMLKEEGITLEGAHAVVLGRSNIVGVPIAALLLNANATVTICHSRSRDLPALCRQADILVAAVGIPELVKGDWIKEGAVVIDVGVNRVDDASRKRGYRLLGDLAYAEAQGRAAAITPVPGGVGPMTIAMLLSNTLRAAQLAD